MKLKFLFLFSTFLFANYLFSANNPIIDSLNKAIINKKVEKKEILYIQKLSSELIEFNLEKYNQIFIQSLEKLDKPEDTYQFAKFFFMQGEICFNNEEKLAALINYFKALDLLKKKNNDSYFLDCINIRIGLCNSSLGLYPEAIKFIENALHAYRNEMSEKEKIFAFRKLGDIHYECKNANLSLLHYQKAYQISEQSRDSSNLILTCIDIGKLYLNLSKYAESEEYTNKAMLLSEKSGFAEGKWLCFFNQSEYYRQLKLYDKADVYCQMGYEFAVQNKLDELRYKSVKNLIEINLIKKNYQKAIQYALYKLDSFDIMYQNIEKKNIYKNLSNICLAQGDLKNVILFQSKYISIIDKIEKSRIQNQLTISELIQNDPISQFHKRLLKNSNKINGEMLRKNRNSLFIAFGFSIILIFFVGYLLNIQRKLKISAKKMEDQNKVILAQSEEIVIQNDDLNKYKNNLEQLIEERTAKLNETLKKAQESDRLKSSFLTNISHEIRTPMNAIIGFAQLIEYSGNDSNIKSLEIIVKNSFELLRTVENIVELAKIQSETYNLYLIEIHPIQLKAKLEAEINRIIKNYPKKEIDFYLEIPDYKNVFITDFLKLIAILSHLLENAFKYTEKGSISITCHECENNFEFKVCDTGIGISENELPHIYDVFYKVENKSRLARGTGLGLAIVKKLIDILKGQISIQSELGKGTDFSLIIPGRLN